MSSMDDAVLVNQALHGVWVLSAFNRPGACLQAIRSAQPNEAMSARGDTWRAMAAELGARMENHASQECGHTPEDADQLASQCPHCQDFVTWRKWAQREIRALRLDRVRANKPKESSE